MSRKFFFFSLTFAVLFWNQRLHPNSPKADHETWKNLRQKRQAELDRYLAAHQNELDWFLHWEFGSSGGIPMAFYLGFPIAYPQIWRPEWKEEIGLPSHPQQFSGPNFPRYGQDESETDLPLGQIQTNGITPFTSGTIQIVGSTCSICHVGRVKDNEGKTHFLIGAPNTTWDPLLYREKLRQTSLQENFTKKETWTFETNQLQKLGFNEGQINRYRLLWNFPGLTTSGINGFKHFFSYPDYVDEKVYRVPGYENDNRIFGGMPGHTDVTILTIGSQIRVFKEMLPKQRDKILAAVLPDQPAIVDFTSVYRQHRQTAGQWDASTEDHVLRTLGAQVASVGNAKLVLFETAAKATTLLSDLPPQPYIFDIDWKKWGKGQAIFMETCGGCHSHHDIDESKMVRKHQGNIYLTLEKIGTDPNRAKALKETTRELLASQLLDSCSDIKHPTCRKYHQDQRPRKQILREVIHPRGTAEEVANDPTGLTKPYGYVAPFLDGIWTRAPYLHNGSVPTLYHMLVPSDRPETFWRGNLEYDTENVGFEWKDKKRPYAVLYDTKKRGYSNQGHGTSNPERFFGKYNFKTDIEAREALLEYLKSL